MKKRGKLTKEEPAFWDRVAPILAPLIQFDEEDTSVEDWLKSVPKHWLREKPKQL